MSYYSEHAQEFIDNTIDCDMSEQYRLFEKYLNKKGAILDIGFGSGRDSLYFKSKGYKVYSIDPEVKFVKHAKELGLDNVFLLHAEDMNFQNMFDGIWACASLLHIKSVDLNVVFKKCDCALKNNGIMYASFKYGEFEGVRNGRIYLDLNETNLISYLQSTNLKVIRQLISKDVRPGREEKWYNVVLVKKVDQCS